MASARVRRGDDRASKLTVDAWKRVLTDLQEQIVSKVTWNDQIIEAFKNRVLSKDEVAVIKVGLHKILGEFNIFLIGITTINRSIKH